MKMKVLKMAMFSISAVMLVGCSGKNVEITANKAKANEIIITASKKVQGVIKEKFDKKYYEEKGLKKFIEDDLKSFNNENGTSIKLNSMNVKDKYVYAVLDYKSAEEYNKYNDYKITTMEASVAKESSSIPQRLSIYGKSKTKNKVDALEKDMKVVVIQEEIVVADDSEIPAESKVDINVTVAGKVKYVVGASKEDGNTVKIKSLKEPVIIVYQ